MKISRTILSAFATILLILAAVQRANARGCLAAGTAVLTPDGPVAVENLKPGDAIWSINESGIHRANIIGTTQVTVDTMLEIHAGTGVLHVTPEHPLQTAGGTYTEAGHLKIGDALWIWNSHVLTEARIWSIIPTYTRQPAYNLMVNPGGTYIASGFAVHNKGCFLPDTPILKSDGTQVPIRTIRAGDRLSAFTPDGQLVITSVENIISLNVDEYYHVTTDDLMLDVTAEHPFFVGNATFKTLEALGVGDTIYAVADGRLQPQIIRSIVRVAQPVTVYNLQTDDPHTFFACGIAVHNKGCFPAGTQIATPGGAVAIESIHRGQQILSANHDGRIVRQTVVAIFQTRSSLLTIHTNLGNLTTTAEHPLAINFNEFDLAGDMVAGRSILRYSANGLANATIDSIEMNAIDTPVYNLEVDGPHTFIADGFVVHNKGGGGHGGGGFGGGHSSYYGGGYYGNGYYGGRYYSNSSTRPSTLGYAFFIMFFALFFFVAIHGLLAARNDWSTTHATGGSVRTLFGRDRAGDDLDFVHTRKAVTPKSQQTLKLLQNLSTRDPSVDPAKLTESVKFTFTQLQKCWQARDYEPMRALLMPDLFRSHCAQLAAMVRQHEINHIDQLEIRFVDFVQLRYTTQPQQREFTALITALACDYYTDDRDGSFIRGDRTQAIFQEFWTFHFLSGQWYLREIEQSRESDALRQKNFIEGMTDVQIEQTAGASGPAVDGPWSDKATIQKTSRIDTLLQNLSKRDPNLWDRAAMMGRVRDIFLEVLLAEEALDVSRLSANNYLPTTLADVKAAIQAKINVRESVEFRNLCVRKVDLVLAHAYPDKNRCEYMARVSAHAQTTTVRNSSVIHHDEFETPFVKYMAMAWSNGAWRMKGLLPEATGLKIASAEK